MIKTASSSRPKLIINADDFGHSGIVNKAILKSFKSGVISNATIMSNMPGFQEACILIKENNLFNKIGVHLNITEGFPLTKPISKIKLFCHANGAFNDKRRKLFYLNFNTINALEIELQAQINALYEAGISPTHIDSHHHYHTEFAIGMLVVKLAKKNDIPAIRLSRNCRLNCNFIKNIYKTLFNSLLKYNRLSKVCHFGNLEDIFWLLKSKKIKGPTELMVHPGNSLYPEDNLINNDKFKKIKSNFEITNYKRLLTEY